MPIITRTGYGQYGKTKKPKQKYFVGKEILKMYKHFPSDQEKEKGERPIISRNGIKRWPMGFCITLVLFDTGMIWTKRTRNESTSGVPNGFRISKKGTPESPNGWQPENRTDETRDQVYARLRADGWILPKNYWMGPPELKPQIAKKGNVKEEEIQEEPEEVEWSPEFLKNKE